MKTTLLIVLLALSLATNAVLFCPRSSTSTAPKPRTNDAGKPDPANPATTAQPVAGPTATDHEVAQLAQTWQRLQSGDLKSLIAQLRAAGFSESMIRSIVASQVYDQFIARRKALIAQQEDNPYWTPKQRFALDPKTLSDLRDLTRQQNNQIKSLLGPDGVFGIAEREAYLRRQFGELPTDKLEQLEGIVSDYNEIRQQVYANANGVILEEDRERLSLLEKEQRADLTNAFTPQELENYELRSSNTANMLRFQLGTFKPTEEEFIAIFRATRAAEGQYGSISTGGANGNQVRQIQTAVLEQTKSFLTPERYADLKQASDPAYQMANRLVARLDLPAAAATQVVTVQQDITKRVGALRSDQSLSPEQRALQLSGLLQEASTSLTNALGGARGLEAYKQYGGQWLQGLQPRISTPPKG